MFDHFFAYLDRVNHYIRIRLIDIRDVESLGYWLEQIRNPRFVRGEPIFARFLEAYEYRGVLDLMVRFEALRPRKLSPALS